MGNKSSQSKNSNKNNTDINSKESSDKDDSSSDFQRISHPSSPDNTITGNINPGAFMITGSDNTELGQSVVLVEKPGSKMTADENKESMNTTPVVGLTSAFSSPSQGGQQQPQNRRRIIKATPPPAGAAVTPVKAKADIDAEEDHPHGKQHLPAVLSPKASTELLEESIEQSKTKRLEQLSREQKSKREKVLEEKRKTPSKKETPQANPFSKFLKIFSVEPAFPHHKRAYEEGDIDREEDAVGGTSATPKSGRNSPNVLIATHNESKRQKLDDSDSGLDASRDEKSLLDTVIENVPEWVPLATGAAAMAAIAVMVALRINAATGGK